MHACPKCGGTEGYYYTLIVAYAQYCEWNGEPIDAEHTFDERSHEGRILECAECGARFRRSTIERGE